MIQSEDHPLFDAQLTISVALQRTRALESVIGGRKPKLFHFVENGQTKLGEPLLELRFKTINKIVSIQICEIANLLRFSLDYACVALALLQNPGVDEERIAFPFAEDQAKWENLAASKRRGGIQLLPLPAKTLIEGLRPYRGGNDALWGLNKLSNMHKHRRIVTMQSDNGAVNFVGLGGGDANDFAGQMLCAELSAAMADAALRADANSEESGFSDGFVFPGLADVPIDLQVAALNNHSRLIVVGCFAEPEPFIGRPIVPTLDCLCEMVQGCIDDLATTI